VPLAGAVLASAIQPVGRSRFVADLLAFSLA